MARRAEASTTLVVVVRTVSAFSVLAVLCVVPLRADDADAPTPSAAAMPTPTPVPQQLPASGQRRSYPARKQGRGDATVEVPDDGRVQAGAALRYRDNLDGTVTDLITGLMWEKKCAGCGGLHDRDAEYHWSGDGKAETIWDWLAQVNAESGGFAGHSDWRVPNIKELVSIVDFGAFEPALAETFHTDACDDGCKDLRSPKCSCTAVDLYWTSTTFSDFPAHALIVDVGYGFVDDRIKTNRHHVRAVRGGVVPEPAPGKK